METILVLTGRDDLAADSVVEELSSRGELVVRIDTADFPTSAGVSVELSSSGWLGKFGGTRAVRLDTVKSVWWRRPNEFRTPHAWPGVARALAQSEARAGVLGVLGSLPVRWINHPSADAAANYKPVQLAVAARVGLDMPQSIITSDPEQARRFVEQVADRGTEGRADDEGNGTVVYKGLGGGVLGPGGRRQMLPVTLVTGADIDQGVAGTAHLFQELVPKAFEVRLTVIGQRMFPVIIHAGSEAARLDWRTDYRSLTYEALPVAEVPQTVVAGVQASMDQFSLYFGAFDFAVRPDGRWVFFEVNPNGQWHWLALRADVPLIAAMADALQGEG